MPPPSLRWCLRLLLKVQREIPHEATSLRHRPNVLPGRFGIDLTAPDPGDELVGILNVRNWDTFQQSVPVGPAIAARQRTVAGRELNEGGILAIGPTPTQRLANLLTSAIESRRPRVSRSRGETRPNLGSPIFEGIERQHLGVLDRGKLGAVAAEIHRSAATPANDTIRGHQPHRFRPPIATAPIVVRVPNSLM